MDEPRPLLGKTAIVTGASRGIGRAIALRLAELGFHCILCARDAAALHEAESAAEHGGCASSIALDLRDPAGPARLVEFALKTTGRVDAVISNAGATRRGDFLSLTEEDWTDGFALKFFGGVRLARAAWPCLKQTSGSLLFISGVGGRTPGAEFTIGGSVNAALLSLTKALAEAGTRDGIRVNAINPGTIRTARFEARLKKMASESGVDLETAEREFVRRARITRIGDPEDVANLVAFVIGPRGTLLQGAILDIDGGATKTI